MSVLFSAIPTENELNTLRFLLSGQFDLELNKVNMILTFCGSFPDKKPLISFEITPGTKKDFSGGVISEFLIAFGGSFLSFHKHLADSTDSMENRIMRMVGNSIEHAVGRFLNNSEYQFRIKEIHSLSEEDWYD